MMVNTGSAHRPRRLLKYSAILLVAAQLAYATFLAMGSWREVKTEQAGRLATIADLDANAIDSYFTQLEIGLSNLGESLSDGRNRLDLGRAYKLVHRFQELHTELGNVILIRADGRILLTGNTPNSRDLPTLAGDSAFVKFRDELQQGPAFAIGRPVMGNIDKRWSIDARYAISDSSGKLAYILSANLPADMLQRYRMDSTSPKISVLGLVRDDGYMVSRYPEPDAASVDDLYSKPADGAMMVYLHANSYPQQGQVNMPNSDGNTTDLRVLHRLQHYPVTLFVDVPMSEIHSAWWGRMRDTYFLMALMLVGIFIFYGMSLRRRRTWSTEKRREVLKHNYEQAMNERSPNEIFMFDKDTLQINYANEHAQKNTGYTLMQLQQKDMLSLHPEIGIESFGAIIEPLRRGKLESVKYRTVQLRSNGSTYPVEASLQLLRTDTGGEGFMAIINDLSALQLAEVNISKFNAPVERRAARRN